MFTLVRNLLLKIKKLKNMKLFVAIACVLMMASCKTSENMVQGNTTSVGESTQSDAKISGKVFVSYKGCPAIIETMVDGNSVKMYPVNLPDEFKMDGLKIKFNFAPSKAMQPEGCTLIDQVVSVENVEKI